MQAESNQLQIPTWMRQWDHWVIWGKDADGHKVVFAPWMRGDLYPAKWGADAPERPETDFETARRFWKHRHSYSKPDGVAENVGQMQPAPLLMHEPPMDPPLMLVDFDDVRDPETCSISDEVADILERLGAYWEISQSGEGLHAYVQANLPGELGKFIEPLQGEGDIELYDHGRAVGATWQKVDGAPDAVPEAQDVIDDLVVTYESQATRTRRLDPNGYSSSGGSQNSGDIDISSDSPTGNTDSDYSAYFDIDIKKVADTGMFKRYGDGVEGPHPAHGPQTSEPENCTNFGIETTHNVWNCFAHDSGGRAIELAAVLCPQTDLMCKDLPQKAARQGYLRKQKPLELARAAIWVRENGVVDEDADPPVAVLAAVADQADLHTGRSDGLGAHAKIARTIFDNLETGDI